MWKLNWYHPIVLLLLATPCFASEAQLSSPLASALCGQYAAYKETKKIQPSLEKLPADTPLLSGCGKWLWNKCDKPGDKNCGSFDYRGCVKGAEQRVIGGTVAGASEFPWDVAIRFIYDWGTFYPEPRPSESIANNDFKGLKESHRCTATIYSPFYAITSAWCGTRAKEYIHTRNRFVLWIARGRFLDAKLVEQLPGKIPKGEIYIHPEFNAEVSTNHRKDHDIAIVRVPKPFKFSKEVYGLEIAAQDKSFIGTKATFTGWGTTHANLTGGMLGNPGMKPGFGSKLYKLELNVLPWAGACEEVVRGYLELDENYDPKEDLSQRYLCAKPDNNDDNAKGACGGDVGGPLICSDNKKNYLCGIRPSWSIVEMCPTKDNLEIFIKPSFYLSWVEQVAGKQNPKDIAP